MNFDIAITTIQILSYFVLVYFLIASIKVVIEGLSGQEHAEQGIVPILAIMYMGFSFIYIYLFINSFHTIVNSIKESLGNSVENWLFYPFILTILFAFILNFSKSLFTLNSLEFGHLYKYKYKDLYSTSKSKTFVESVIRLFIAFFFIKLEHHFSLIEIKTKLEPNTSLFSFTDGSETIIPKVSDFLIEAGYYGMWLYGLILAWFYFNLYVEKIKIRDYSLTPFFNNNWKIWSQIQFYCGLFISLAIYLIGKEILSRDFLMLSFGVTIILGTLIILSITIIDWQKEKKNPISIFISNLCFIFNKCKALVSILLYDSKEPKKKSN